jgi:uncharacterized membrane protein YhhN
VTRPLTAAAVAATAAAHIAAGLSGNRRLADATQPALMPVVAAHLLTSARRSDRAVVGVAAGLAAACLGDTVPRFQRDDTAFRTLIVCFVGTHVAYLAALAPAAARRVRDEPRRVVVPAVGYGALLAGVLGTVLPGARASRLHAAVIGYGVLLSATGVVTALAGGRIAVGGALFAASDAMIALGRFVPGWRARIGSLDVQDAVVMSTYVAAQALIADGVAQR